jgi:hypothetical protein
MIVFLRSALVKGACRRDRRAAGKSRRRVVVTGSYEATENLGPPYVDSGTLQTTVSWTLTFIRARG